MIGTPGKRGSAPRFEMVLRIRTVLGWLARGMSQPEITILAEKKWDVRKRQVQRYINRAYAWELRAAAVLKESYNERSRYRVRFMRIYESVLSDPLATNRDKIHAARAWSDELDKLDERARHMIMEHRGEVGVNGEVGVLIEELRKQRSLRDLLVSKDGLELSFVKDAPGNGNGCSLEHADGAREGDDAPIPGS